MHDESTSLRVIVHETMHKQARYQAGAVNLSSSPSHAIACVRSAPHISIDGCKPPQNAGRSGLPKMRHRLSSASCTQRTPAGLPLGMPGIGLVIDGAVQQAPQPLRQASGEVERVMASLEGWRAGRGEPSSISFMLRHADCVSPKANAPAATAGAFGESGKNQDRAADEYACNWSKPARPAL